jgi:hypothetical protein
VSFACQPPQPVHRADWRLSAVAQRAKAEGIIRRVVAKRSVTASPTTRPGGAILEQGNSVHGTATAASLWATGAVGVSVGLGSFDYNRCAYFSEAKALTLVKDGDQQTRLTKGGID